MIKHTLLSVICSVILTICVNDAGPLLDGFEMKPSQLPLFKTCKQKLRSIPES